MGSTVCAQASAVVDSQSMERACVCVSVSQLCYPYHSNMRDDYGVFHYGFLQDLEDPPILMEVS